MKINSICILGGGTAGFAVASILSRYRQISGSKFDIKLVYSKKIGSIGVGESTVRNVNEFFNYLDLNDRQWMKKCDATYKAALKFTDFNKGSYFYYPFGDIPADKSRYDFLSKWFIGKEFCPEICTSENVATFFIPHTILAEKNKLTDSWFDLKENTAYHFDASKLGSLLEKYSKKRGVEIIEDEFVGALHDEDGYITELSCKNGTYGADLFVDCSGFESLLLGQTMKEEFISFSDNLINNKALVARIPYTDKEKQLKNYTDSIALKNGWCWEIPLWNCMSVGYVHTNQFATEEEIEQEFFDRYGEVEYKPIEYKTGRYERGWVKNVVGVGLAYGFIEPLESTGLATTFMNCFRLLEAISKRDRNCTQLDRDLFNNSVGDYGIDIWRAQVLMHYFLSIRDDTKYWKHITEKVNYRSNINSEFSYEQFLYRCGITRNLQPNPAEPGPMFITAGMEYSPFSRAMILSENLPEEYRNMDDFDKQLEEMETIVKKLPSSYEFLRKTIYN